MEEKEPGKATGPRTKAGKRRASQNARTHGLRASKLILKDERQEDYDRLRQGWHGEYQPENYRAQRLVDRVVLNDWLLARAERRLLAAEAGTAGAAGCDPLDWSDEQHDRVQLMHRYKSTLERAFQRVYRDLETLRRNYERARQAVRERMGQESESPECGGWAEVMARKVTVELRPAQMEVFRCAKRFRVLAAGRRFGKTQLALVEMLRAASGKTTVWYVAPSLRQAKQIVWERLKELSRPFWRGRPNESELSIRTRSGAVMALRGADRYDSLRGSGLDFVVLDEYASMKPECWTEVLRPALADRRGGALFIGTPQGSNHLRERFEQAQQDPEWGAFQFTTLEGGNVSAEELASAAKELDGRLFRQEFEASFDSGARGRAYHAFSRAEHVRRCEFRPGEPLIWALDFNVDPLCAVLVQCAGKDIQVLQEMVLVEATTALACQELLARTREWRRLGTVFGEIYGDASGYQRRTCGPETDWSTVSEFFKGWRGEFKATMRVPRQNPAVRERVSAMNAKLLNAAGERRLFVDPQCKELIKDLESVRWKADASGTVTGELDKSSKMRTHLSDALGYYVAQKFSVKGTVGLRDCGRVV